ncbi:MAG: chitobiase/beta-hexosaminidase C-terminal domain-containing protein [Bacteroidales bacterium]|nr:chitobiase/beta-hexosaminidase C-terminal domain-containing protein [Bacteroidales bacterium]
MKKFFILFVTALAGLTVLSCNKEANINDAAPEAPAIHFTVLAEGTKTVVDAGEEWVNWEATDALSIYETINYTESETAKKQVHTGTAAVSELSNGNKTASFEATLPAWDAPAGATVNGASYVAVNPSGTLSQGGSGDNKFWRMQMPSTQTPVIGSFDPAADLLLSAPVNQAARVATGDKMSFRFHRLGTAVKMTLKGLPVGEKLQSITLTAPVNIAGYVKVDLTNGGYVNDDAKPYASQSKVLTLDIDNWEVTDSNNDGEGDDIEVWFRVTADSWSGTLKISAETDQASYYRDGTNGSSAISLSTPMVFADGGRTRFPLSLGTTGANAAVRVAKDPSKILAEGNYLILAKVDGAASASYYALKAETVSSDTRMASVDYTGDLDAYSGDADMIWSLTKSGSSYIIANNGNYLGYKGNDNKAFWEAPGSEWSETNYLMNINWDATNNCYHVVCKNFSGRTLSRLESSDWFAFYTSDQQKNLIFVPATVDNRTAVTLSFTESEINLTTANASSFTGQVASADPNVAAITGAITYAITGDAIGTVNENTGAVTLNGTLGTATVTASFAGDTNYRPATAGYTINVTNGNIDYASLQTSNVTLSTTDGTNASTATVNGYDALKAGKSAETGAVVINVPAGTTNLHLHAAGWKGDNVTLGITAAAGISADPASLVLTSNDGVSNNSPFTLSSGSDVADYYFNVALTGITADTPITFAATSGNRFVIWGVNAVADTRADAEISWSASAKTVTYSTGNTNDFSPYSFNNPNNVEVTYASTDETIASIDATTGAITMTALSGNSVKEGSTTIKAIFAGSTDYKPATASYTLTVVDGRDAVATPTFDPAAGAVAANSVVNFVCSISEVTFHYTENGSNPTLESPTGTSVTIDATKTVKVLAEKTGYKPSSVASATYSIAGTHDFESIAELNALATSTSATKSGYLTNAVVSFVPATNTAIVKDATGSVMFYKKDHGLKQGQTFSGEIAVSVILYNSLYSEVTDWGTASFTGSETAVAPESIAMSALIGHYNDYQNAYVQVAGLTVTAIDGTSNKNVHVTDGTNSYVVFYNPGSPTCAVGDVITAIGTITKYGDTEELKVWKAADLIVTASAPKSITFSQPSGAAGTAGCSFTVSVGGSPITSGDTVADGTTVTLTATAGTDYQFSSWTVTGATVANATASTTTFEMGTTAVTVSATFSSTGGGGGGSYTITFSKGSGDGTSASTSTSCSSIVSAGSANLSGNLATATKVYYGGSGGLKLGTSSAAGVVKMNLASSVTPTSIVVSAKLYNSGKSATLKVNGSATQSVTADYSNLTFNITSATTYLQLESSKYMWVESITVNY